MEVDADESSSPVSGPPSCGTGVTPLRQFLDDARTFLDASLPRRAGTTERWGSGSDRVSLFTERSVEEDAAEVAAACAWRARLFDAGYGWIAGPANHGGRDLPIEYEDAFAALESEYETPDAAHLRFGVHILAPTLLTYGSPEQQAALLAPLRRGDIVACQLFSEPDAGSDLSSLKARATLAGDVWIVNGQKVWCSGAQFSSVGMLIARTGDEPRHRGLSTFLMDLRLPGVVIRPIQQVTGGASFNEVFLEDVAVADTDRFGELGRGWDVVTTCLVHERAAIGQLGADEMTLVGRLTSLAQHVGRLEEPVVRHRLAAAHERARAPRVVDPAVGRRPCRAGAVDGQAVAHQQLGADRGDRQRPARPRARRR